MSTMPELLETDVLVIGCGVAGATTALHLANECGLQVTVVTKADNLAESNTYYAQGGIIYRGPDDDPQKLAADITRAGDGLNDERAVRILSKEGPRLVRELLVEQYGVPFDTRDDGELHVTREAAHSTSRILHAQDATGRAIQVQLVKALENSPNIRLLTGCVAVDLLTPAHHSLDRRAIYEHLSCVGAYVYAKSDQRIHRIVAKATVLASGGLGEVFLHTSNPAGATGDGVAMAYRAGARIINSEYVQFHPTTFYHRGESRFLLSETLRGEGAHLLNVRGERFMERYEPKWKELAPRDEVARSIHQEMLRTESSHVYLDLASVMESTKIEERFPTICAKCRELGVDPAREPMPAVPAAHYFCGGVWVDEWGHTSLHRLYAVGEVSCTGVHGANRLGSASLLEGLVWGRRAAQDIADNIPGRKAPVTDDIPKWREEGVNVLADPALLKHDMSTIKHTMWYYVGLVRSRLRLERALRDLGNLRRDVESFYRTTRLEPGIINLRNASLAAIIVARAAWENRESHGCHYRVD